MHRKQINKSKSLQETKVMRNISKHIHFKSTRKKKINVIYIIFFILYLLLFLYKKQQLEIESSVCICLRKFYQYIVPDDDRLSIKKNDSVT